MGKKKETKKEPVKFTEEDRFTIATPCMGKVHLEYHISQMNLYKPRMFYISNNVVPLDVARNRLVAKFLCQHPESSHLLFWDSDIMPPPYGLIRMWKRDIPVISGLYFQKHPPFSPVVGIRMSDYEGDAVHLLVDWIPNKVISVDAVGCGFLLIRRDVFQAWGPPWFKFGKISEDFYFALQARRAGFEVAVDTSIVCKHVSDRVFIGIDNYNQYRKSELQRSTVFHANQDVKVAQRGQLIL